MIGISFLLRTTALFEQTMRIYRFIFLVHRRECIDLKTWFSRGTANEREGNHVYPTNGEWKEVTYFVPQGAISKRTYVMPSALQQGLSRVSSGHRGPRQLCSRLVEKMLLIWISQGPPQIEGMLRSQEFSTSLSFLFFWETVCTHVLRKVSRHYEHC